jgi:hypothetical protein
VDRNDEQNRHATTYANQEEDLLHRRSGNTHTNADTETDPNKLKLTK